jgi:Ca2+-binding EF-hand superfamily protein
MASNSERGSQIPAFYLIEDLRKANMNVKAKSVIVKKLLPENLLKDPENTKLMTDFAVTKVLKGCAARGWNVEKLFTVLDKDKAGTIDTEEILKGCKQHLNVFLTNDQG